MKGETYYTYGFVRLDLPVVQQIIQFGHATHEAALLGAPRVAPHVCLFEVENERELIDVSRELDVQGVRHALFYEPDGDVGYTALATAPIAGADREWFFRAGYRRYGSAQPGSG